MQKTSWCFIEYEVQQDSLLSEFLLRAFFSWWNPHFWDFDFPRENRGRALSCSGLCFTRWKIKQNKKENTQGTSSWLGATTAFLTASLSALTSSSSSSRTLGCCWLLSLLGEILKKHQIYLRILFFTSVLHQCISTGPRVNFPGIEFIIYYNDYY